MVRQPCYSVIYKPSSDREPNLQGQSSGKVMVLVMVFESFNFNSTRLKWRRSSLLS